MKVTIENCRIVGKLNIEFNEATGVTMMSGASKATRLILSNEKPELSQVREIAEKHLSEGTKMDKWVEVSKKRFYTADNSRRRTITTYDKNFTRTGRTYEIWLEELSLPTESGVKFWGQQGTQMPCWWFSTIAATGQLVYCSEHGGWFVDINNNYSQKLFRLPDPD